MSIINESAQLEESPDSICTDFVAGFQKLQYVCLVEPDSFINCVLTLSSSLGFGETVLEANSVLAKLRIANERDPGCIFPEVAYSIISHIKSQNFGKLRRRTSNFRLCSTIRSPFTFHVDNASFGEGRRSLILK